MKKLKYTFQLIRAFLSAYRVPMRVMRVFIATMIRDEEFLLNSRSFRFPGNARPEIYRD